MLTVATTTMCSPLLFPTKILPAEVPWKLSTMLRWSHNRTMIIGTLRVRCLLIAGLEYGVAVWLQLLLFVSPVVLSRAHADEARFVALQLPLAR
jgi:hypothetical protein